MNDFHFNFYQARAHHAKHEFARAAEFCAKALEFNPNHTDALSLYGGIKAAQGRHSQARDIFAAAVGLEPQNTSLLLHLGSALKELGDFAQAREHLEKAVALDKTFAPAYYILSTIIRFKPDDPLIDDFERLKKRVYGNRLYRCVTCFSLGKIYDDIGAWDRAFENYAEGNRLRGARYDHAQTQNMLDAIKRVFSSQALVGNRQTGHPSRKPVFIIGMPRSGSSLIEDILSRARNVVGLGEPHDIENLFTSAYKAGLSPDKTIRLQPAIDSARLIGLGETYLNTMESIAPGAERIIDKNVLNHAMVGFIRLIFPNAAIIRTARNPIDTCLSCYFQNFTEGQEYSFDLGDIAKRYAAYADIMKHWDAICGNEIFTASYEKMIRDKDAEISKLFAHIGTPAPDPEESAEPAQRAVPTASAWQVRQPIYATSVDRWRRYEKHLGPLFQAFKDIGFDYDGVG